MKKTVQTDKFYNELDENKQRSSGCSCASMAVALLLILILAETCLFIFAGKLRFSGAVEDITRPNISSSSNFSAISQENKTDLIIQEGTLCSKLAELTKKKNFGCRISPEGIYLSGKTSYLAPANLTSCFKPEADGGKLNVKLTEVMIGTIKAPDFLAAGLSRSISKVISDSYPDLANSSVESVYLQDGVMTVSVKK